MHGSILVATMTAKAAQQHGHWFFFYMLSEVILAAFLQDFKFLGVSRAEATLGL